MRGRPFCNPWYFSITTRKAKAIDVPHQLLKECNVQLYTTRTINTFTRVKARNKSTVWQMDLSVRCGFTLKLVRDMIITYSQMHRKDKYSQQSSIIWPVWQNILVFVYELSGCGFETRCCHLYFRYGTCFEQGVPDIQANYTVWIHSETRTWHDNKTRWNIVMFQQSSQSTYCILYSVRFMQMP